jgi:hypothetical protein
MYRFGDISGYRSNLAVLGAYSVSYGSRGSIAALDASIPPLLHAGFAFRLLRDLGCINLRAILRAAAEAGAQWGTLEELAR